MGKRRPRKADKQMEYPDAPSGFVRLYNYKEPFIPYKKGYGYEGVLLMDGSGKTVQCHICGEWLYAIHRGHLMSHRLTASEYKELVGLRQTTALISEEYRQKLLDHVPPKRKEWSDFTKEEQEAIKLKYRATMAKRVREHQNERGTCPIQLIERLRQKTRELGREPYYTEIAAWAPTLVRVFGSHQEAYRRAGLEPRTIHSNRGKVTNHMILQEGVSFFKVHQRAPTYSDHMRGLFDYTYSHCEYRFKTHRAFRQLVEKTAKGIVSSR